MKESISNARLLEILSLEIIGTNEKIINLKELVGNLTEKHESSVKVSVISYINALTSLVDELKQISIETSNKL